MPFVECPEIFKPEQSKIVDFEIGWINMTWNIETKLYGFVLWLELKEQLSKEANEIASMCADQRLKSKGLAKSQKDKEMLRNIERLAWVGRVR